MTFESKAQVVAGLMAAGLLVLGARLWDLQMIQGERYDREAFENRLRYERVPSPRGIIYDREGRPLVKNSPYYYVAVHPDMLDRVDTVAVADFLNLDPTALSETLKKSKNTLEPVRIKGGLRFDEVAYIEARVSEHPGLLIEAEETRHYLYGEAGSHYIGYLGKLNPQQALKEEHKDVPTEAFVGQWGVEKLFDGILRGEPGKRVIEVDALGRNLRLFKEIPPAKGQDVYLSIDLDVQLASEAAIGNKVGAIVALKVDTGEVLAMVSRPAFDPNLFSRGINYEDWRRLTEDEKYPMLNRAMQSVYPPGSTFKIVTALAALETGANKHYTRYTCNGVLVRGPWRFRCWNRGGHGSVDMHLGLIQSCDVYFYQTGDATGMDNIARYARLLGFGSDSGLRLTSERTGLVPDAEWKARVYKAPWYLGETYNAAIGQGYVLVTPLQLAEMMATVANGGLRYPISITRAEGQPKAITDLALSKESVRVIKDALWGVVKDPRGTGKAAQSSIVSIGGKTGTAQVAAMKEPLPERLTPEHLRDHAWFVAFAPVEKPEIAVAVLVEHGGHGGSAAAPIAKLAIEAYMKKKVGAAVEEHVRN